MSKKIITTTNSEFGVKSTTNRAPKIGAVHPFGSKILVEVLLPDEVLGTNLYVAKETEVDGAPQAYILELGPQVAADTGLKVGQRIYWTGKGTPVNDPRGSHGRVRALLEVHNIQAIIEEEGTCCGGSCHA